MSGRRGTLVRNKVKRKSENVLTPWNLKKKILRWRQMWTDRTVLALSLARLPSARESLVSYRARLQEVPTKHSHTCQETNCLPEKGWATKQRDAGRGHWDPRGRRLSAGHSSTLIRPLYAASVPTSSNNLLVVAWLPVMSTHRDKTLVHTDKYWLDSVNVQIWEVSSSGPKKLPCS